MTNEAVIEARLNSVAEAEQLLTKAKLDFKRSVLSAHEAGATWAQIASVLGVTRQAAWQRFGLTTSGEHQ